MQRIIGLLFNGHEFIFLFLPITFFANFYLLNKRLIVAAKGVLVFSIRANTS